MKQFLKKFRLRRPDEMERHILFKAQRNSYFFLVAALLAWSLWESCRTFVHHTRPNLLPCLLLVAADAGEGAQRRAMHFAEEGQCLLAEIPCSKEELGAALGRKSCAMAALTDLGLAQAVAGRLAQGDPERYGEMTERLRLKAERAAQRREKTARERQQRGGGKRPPVKYRKK